MNRKVIVVLLSFLLTFVTLGVSPSAGAVDPWNIDTGIRVSGNQSHLFYYGNVEASTGQLYFGEIDHTVTVSGNPFGFTRYYNSNLVKSNLSFGEAWSSILDMRLLEGRYFVKQDGAIIDLERDGYPKFDGESKVVDRNFVCEFDDNGLPLRYRVFSSTSYTDYSFSIDDSMIKSISINDKVIYRIKWREGHVRSITDPLGRKTSYTYAGGRLIKVTSRASDDTYFRYDTKGRLISTDRKMDDIETQFNYDKDNRITQILLSDGVIKPVMTATYYDNQNSVEFQDYSGSTVTVILDDKGRPDIVLNPYFMPTEYEYNDANRVTKVTDALQNTTEYAYDSDGNLIESTDALGGQQISVWGVAGGRPVLESFTDKLGAKTTFEYDSEGLPLVITNALASSWTNAYSDGQLISTTDPTGANWSYEYDDMNNLTTETLPNGDTLEYNLDKAGRRISHTEPNGATTEYEYDIKDRATTITDAMGNKIEYAYDQWDNVVKVTDPYGSITENKFDENGQLIESKDADGISTCFKYDHEGNRVKTIDNRENAIINEYDEMGNIVSSTDADGMHETYEYDELGRLAKMIGAWGAVHEYGYDALDRLTKIEDPFSVITEFEYDPAGNILSKTEGGQLVSSYEYDILGRLTSETTHPDGEYAYEYDGLNRVTAITDPIGGINSFEYDSLGNIIKGCDYAGNCTIYQWGCCGELLGVTNPDGTKRSFSYDLLHRQISATDEAGYTTESEFDKLSRITRINHPDGTSVKYFYDKIGQLSSTVNEQKKRWSFEYSDAGNLVKTIDPEGNEWNRIYDDLGYPEKEINPDGGVTSFEYDAGMLVKSTDPDGVESSYRYDIIGRPYQTAVGGVVVDETAYDTLGRIACTISGGIKTEYSYDIQDRLIGIDVGGIESSYHYDKLGRLIAVSSEGENSYARYDGSNPQPYAIMNNAGETLIKRFDSMGRVTSLTSESGLSSWLYYDERGLTKRIYHQGQGLIEIEYDSMGRPMKSTDGNGRTIELDYENGLLIEMKGTDKTETYEYDDLGRLTRIGFDGDNELLTKLFGYGKSGQLTSTEVVFKSAEAKIEKDYYLSGKLKSVKYPDDTLVSYEWGNCGMLDKIMLPDGSIDFTYNNKLQIDSMTLPGGISQKLSYGDDGKVTSASWSNTDLDFEYKYDDAGRLTKKDSSWGIEKYDYDDAGRLTTWQTATRTLDLDYENGRLKKADNYDLHYLDSKLAGYGDTGITYDRSGRMTGKGDTSFAYDSFGILSGITSSDEEHSVEIAGMGLARFDDSLFLSEIDVPMVRMDEDGNVQDIYVFDPSGSPIASISDETLYYLNDGSGSIIGTANKDGLSDTFRFNPFGTHDTDADWSSPFRWKGYFFLPDVNLYHLGARQFDPELMSFTSFDPGYPSLTTDDPYAYANHDPINGYDVLGLADLDCSSFTTNDYIKLVRDDIKVCYPRNSVNASKCVELKNGSKITCACLLAIRDKERDTDFARLRNTGINAAIAEYNQWVRAYNDYARKYNEMVRAYNSMIDVVDELERQEDWAGFRLFFNAGFALISLIPGIGTGMKILGWIKTGVEAGSSLAEGDSSAALESIALELAGPVGTVIGLMGNINDLLEAGDRIDEVKNKMAELKRELDRLDSDVAPRFEEEKERLRQRIRDARQKNYLTDFWCNELNAAINDPSCTRCDSRRQCPVPPGQPNPPEPEGGGIEWGPMGPDSGYTPGYLRRDDEAPRPSGDGESDPTHCVSGRILEKLQADGMTYIKIKTLGGKILVLIIDSDTRVTDENGVVILVCNLTEGDRIRACGNRESDSVPCADTMEPDSVSRARDRTTPRPYPGDPPDPGVPLPPIDENPPEFPPWNPKYPPYEPPPPHNGDQPPPPLEPPDQGQYLCPCTWESYHKDRWNSGISRDPLARIMKYRKLEWTYRFDSNTSINTSPIMHDTYTVVNAVNGEMVKLSKSGEEEWKFTPDHPVDNPFTPAFCTVDKWIFTSTKSGELIAVDFMDGKEVWATDLGNPAVDSPTHFSARVFVGAGQDLVCVNSNTGSVMWRADLGAEAVGVPAVTSSDRSVVIGDDDGVLHCYGVNGKENWKRSLGGNLGSPVCSFLKIFISAGDSMFGLDENGKILWENDEGTELENPVAISKGHRVVYLAGDTLTTVSEDGDVLFEEPASDRYLGLTGTHLMKIEDDATHTVTTFDHEHDHPVTHLIDKGEEIEALYPSTLGANARTWRTSAFCDSAMVFGNEDGEVHYYSSTDTQVIEQEEDKIILQYQQGNDNYWINGEEKKMDAPAINRWNRMFLPVRFVGTDIGMNIDWDGDERKVTLTSAGGGRVIELWIGKKDATVTIDGKMEHIQIDASNPEVVPIIESQRTYLPLRFCGDNLGAEDILYNAQTKTATLIYLGSILNTMGVMPTLQAK